MDLKTIKSIIKTVKESQAPAVELYVSYPLKLFPIDDTIDGIVGTSHGDSGAGFGSRDLWYTFSDKASAEAAAQRVRQSSIQGITARVSDLINEGVPLATPPGDPKHVVTDNEFAWLLGKIKQSQKDQHDPTIGNPLIYKYTDKTTGKTTWTGAVGPYSSKTITDDDPVRLMQRLRVEWDHYYMEQVKFPGGSKDIQE